MFRCQYAVKYGTDTKLEKILCAKSVPSAYPMSKENAGGIFMAKIAIDAGHGGADPGAVFEGRQEKDDNLRLALAVGEILERNGMDVFYTRTEDVYQTPFQKATLANQENADFFVSMHRNSSPVPNQYTGVESLVYNKSGERLEIAEAINENLEKVGFRNIGVKERPGLVVLRRTRMPAVLVEAGFINSEEDNRMFDEEFDRIAQGIANGILSTVRDSGAASVPEDEVYYRVQTGAFKNLDNAVRMNDELEAQGYPAFIIEKDGYYLVQVGAFRNLGNAVRMEGILRSNGYQTYITT